MNNTDTAIRRLDARDEDEIGAMAISIMQHRRKQFGSDVLTANDYRRVKQIIAIAMDAQPTNDGKRIDAKDRDTKTLAAMEMAVLGSMQQGYGAGCDPGDPGAPNGDKSEG